MANIIAKHACNKGFANASHVDIDSTIQTPDMQFPTSANLLAKAASVGRRIQKLLLKKLPEYVKDKISDINMKEIKGIVKEHNFDKSHNVKKRKGRRKTALTKLWGKVSEAVQPVIRFGRMLTEPFIFESLNKREQNAVSFFITQTPALLTDIYEHCYDHTKRRAYVYSFNRKAVSLFNKNKYRKGLEYGRQYQIGRSEGSYLYSIPNDFLRMPDAENFKKMLKGHIETFQTPIESINADKGYYSKANERLALGFGIKKVAKQRPNKKLKDPPDNPLSAEDQEALYNRRSGIEPLISYLKRKGVLLKLRCCTSVYNKCSRAKTDQSTESSGFTSILGFNLRQMMRYLNGNAKPLVAAG